MKHTLKHPRHMVGDKLVRVETIKGLWKGQGKPGSLRAFARKSAGGATAQRWLHNKGLA
jgi:hypothetical protein